MKISKTTEDRYNEMLEVLPPQATSFINGNALTAFLVGETTSYKDGAPTFASFFKIDGEYYEGEAITEDEFKAFCALPEDEQLADEEDATGEIADELELIDTLGEEVVRAGKEAGIPLKDIEEAYQGKYDSDEDFAREMAEQTGFEMPDAWPYNCIDWEYAGRELMHDYTEQDGHYFRNL